MRCITAIGCLLLMVFQCVAGAQQVLPLLNDDESFSAWRPYNGQEFPGAKVSLHPDGKVRHNNLPSLRIEGDFTEGGNYVEASTAIGMDVSMVSFWLRFPGSDGLSIRLIDGTDQCHQIRFHIEKSDDWQRIVLPVADFFARRGQPDAVQGIAKYEYWGGANDGKWHSPAKSLHILLSKDGQPSKRTLWICDVQAVTQPTASAAAAYTESFDAAAASPEGWSVTGDVVVDQEASFKGGRSLRLTKTEQTLNDSVVAIGPAFDVSAGQWQIQAATRSDLVSPDNSYSGSVTLELLNASGGAIRQVEIVNQFKVNNWTPVSKAVDIPAEAARARFRVQINKQTPGRFWVDELSATPSAVAKDDRIKRIMFGTARLGNLLYPEDSRKIELIAWADQPLAEAQQTMRVVVTDFWGAEQGEPMQAQLRSSGRHNQMFVYKGEVDLAHLPLEIGRYYEIHGSIEREGAEPFSNYTSLAILPEAPANSFDPLEIPFTSRNWDNRIEEYVRLTHRLGVRICGVWGGWNHEPPYDNWAPQLKLIEELGMGWLTGVPSSIIEGRGKNWEKYDEKVLREGVRRFIADYGHVRPMVISLGNEPHNKGDAVLPEVNAYRILYDEIKKIDPSIIVVGTSVGVVEDYFKAGFGEWCDVYDFHVYEDAMGVRRALKEHYPAMFEKYGHAKPIWSTELGLNSQGLSRQTVAAEVYRKFTNFFAAGGQNVSWFGLLYPDGDGTSHDSFGAAHNVFDSRYNRYAPKLDAIAYYNSVNTILNKKFVDERVYGEDTRAFLFRNQEGASLQVLYKDKGRIDTFIPLPGVGEVEVIWIDGTRTTLDAGGEGITLTLSNDPVSITYQGGPEKLPAELGEPAISLASAPQALVRTEKAVVEVTVNRGSAEQVTMAAQPLWTVEKAVDGNIVRFTLSAPEQTNARELDTAITIANAAGRPAGQIRFRPAVTGTLSVQILPVGVVEGQPPAVKLVVTNNSPIRQDVTWDLSLIGQQRVIRGNFEEMQAASAYFADTPSGMMSVEGRSRGEVIVPLAKVHRQTVYRVRAAVRDASGRMIVDERPVGGFVAVPKAQTAPVLDGVLDDAVWQRAEIQRLDEADQFYAFGKQENQATWTGPADLSADIRFAWDEQYLYLGVEVTDDIAGPVKPDYDVWQQDGLQMLIDPMRTSAHKVGKYDYAVGEDAGKHRVRCYLSADGSIQLGDITTWKVATRRGENGNITYEIAIPWSAILPFQPATGANLGFTLILNEDDGFGRDSFMTWFGNAHNKDIDKVGDLILVD